MAQESIGIDADSTCGRSVRRLTFKDEGNDDKRRLCWDLYFFEISGNQLIVSLEFFLRHDIQLRLRNM